MAAHCPVAAFEENLVVVAPEDISSVWIKELALVVKIEHHLFNAAYVEVKLKLKFINLT